MSELAVREDEQLAPIVVQPLTLFGTSDPVEVLDKAVKIARALADVIERQKLYTVIGTKKHVHVEGWTLLGSMLGVFPRVAWTRKLEDGWEARAEAVVAANGSVIGAGDAECLRGESTWRNRDDYALRGMAQTRAISRALRGPLDFVIRLAGYASTSAEEMPATANEAFGKLEGRRRQRAVETPAVRATVAADITATSDAKDDLAAQDSGSVVPPSDEIGDMDVLYKLARTLPKTPQTAPEIDNLVAEHGYKRILMRLKSAHALQCKTSNCEHLQ